MFLQSSIKIKESFSLVDPEHRIKINMDSERQLYERSTQTNKKCLKSPFASWLFCNLVKLILLSDRKTDFIR